MISDFVKLRGPMVLAPRDVERLRDHLVEVLQRSERLPTRGQGLDWRAIAIASGVDVDALVRGRDVLRPGLEALRRELRKAPVVPPRTATLANAPVVVPLRPVQVAPRRFEPDAPRPLSLEANADAAAPEEQFYRAFDREMRRHHETTADLRRDLCAAGYPIEYSTLRSWRLGLKAPVNAESLAILAFLELRWNLETGYFRRRLPHPARATKGQAMPGITSAERRRLAWHLPDDFDRLGAAEQEVILEWVRRVVVTGATDYRRYQANAMKHRFAVRFPDLQRVRPPAAGAEPRGSGGTIIAPPRLAREMIDLLAFKTATLSPAGYRRRGTWGAETASQKVEHFGLMFGALASPPDGPVQGHGVPVEQLTFALLTVPAVWDWYLRWRERRRGFYTAWEVDMLIIGGALTGAEAGWITQTPALAERLEPISGLVSAQEVARIRSDWPAACVELHRFALARSKEIARVAQVHHDSFEPILGVLEADSPVGEYRKIADVIVALRPCARRYPLAAAESSRAFLMIRLGLHLGFRQKNLRQLLVCPRGEAPRTERKLRDQGAGELRWSDRDGGWEVFVPASAFKNATSSFFNGRPFRLILPDIGDLYGEIEAYVETHRARLLGPAADPGTFFIKTVKSARSNAAYDQNTFYEAWRWIIQRYGIYNPYTGRGAIPGLLPHGPHSVRDVLATHILKQTGSYEQASYAIQDTPETVAQHYGRFLPQDKAAVAAQVLNRAWEAA
jgi:hypothetical protein